MRKSTFTVAPGGPVTNSAPQHALGGLLVARAEQDHMAPAREGEGAVLEDEQPRAVGHRHRQVAPVARAAQLAADGVGHRDARLARVHDAVHVGRAREVGDAGRRHARADRQPGVRVDAHRLRVGRAEDEVPARAGAVLPAAGEQLAARRRGPAASSRDAEEREAPDALADQRERHAGDARRRARPPSCRRGRCRADGGCARAGGRPARPRPRPRRSCRARRGTRGRRRPRPRRASGG